MARGFRRQVPYADRPLVFFDLETTGFRAGYNEITEAAFIHEKLGAKCIRIAPRHMERFHPDAQRVSGYREADWIDAKDLSALTGVFYQYLEDAIVIGHNILGFDMPFMAADFRAKNLTPPDVIEASCIDTQQLALMFLRSELRNLKLSSVCTYFGISNEGEHNAYDDVLRTKLVFEKFEKHCKWHGKVKQEELW